MEWWNSYVGIPFQVLGSDREGADCWGLCVLVLREVFNFDMPRHRELSLKAHAKGVAPEHLFSERFVETENPQPGDILHMYGLYQGKKSAIHVGVVTSDRHHILHVEEDTTSAIINIRRPLHSWRPIAYYKAEV